jgi:hypothetical protein
MTLTFDVSAPINCTLQEFGVEPVREDVIALENKIKAYAAKTGQDPETVLDNLQSEVVVRKKKGKGAE